MLIAKEIRKIRINYDRFLEDDYPYEKTIPDID